MKRNTKSLPRIIIDTSTLFSAIYNRKGNEAQLLELADQEKCEIIIFDFVIEEIEAVFLRKDMDIDLVYDLLDICHNIMISPLEKITPEEVSMSKELIDDPLDRPIFIFSYREIHVSDDTFFVSGDKGFFKKGPRGKLNNKVLHTIEALEIING